MTRDLPLSVNVSLPTDCENLIRERVRAAEACGEIEVWTTVIHGALWEMRNRRKLILHCIRLAPRTRSGSPLDRSGVARPL